MSSLPKWYNMKLMQENKKGVAVLFHVHLYVLFASSTSSLLTHLQTTKIRCVNLKKKGQTQDFVREDHIYTHTEWELTWFRT